jgi:hypothetical protein
VSMDDMDGILVKSSSDENQVLVAHTRKGRRGSLGIRDSPEREVSPNPRRKKDLSNIICFECHDFGNYASQFPHCMGRGRRKQASTTEVDDIIDRFQREILSVSSLSCTVSNRGTCLVDSRESYHITSA